MYLEIRNLTAGYGGHPVMRDFSLGLRQGEFAAVVGPNGSGKSTLLKVVAGGLRPMAGQVFLNGRDLYALAAAERARHVAVVPQETAVEFDFTVYEVVAMGRLPYLRRLRGETAADRDAVERAMAETDTWRLRDLPITTLSGGERQRVLVARALAQEPHLLLLDEPTAHLDLAHQIDLLDRIWLLNQRHGLTVLAVLHDLNLAAQYARHLIMLRAGEVYAAGPPRAVVTERYLTSVYGSPVRVVPHPVEGTPHVVLLSRAKEDQSLWNATRESPGI